MIRKLAAFSFIVIGLFLLYEAVEQPRSGAFRPVFTHGRGQVVALTFDDGPTPGVTDAVLTVLERERTPATFFAVGRAVRAHPQLVARMVRDGFSVQNHSDTHAHLNAMFPGALGREIDDTNAAIVAAGAPSPRWLRPPFGARNAAVIDAATARGMRVVTWSAAALDGPGLAGRVQGGDVVLLHDGMRGTGRLGERAFEAAGVAKLIVALRARGLRFVTVDELARTAP